MTCVPFEDALQRSPRDVLHEDVDGGQVHAGAEVADNVSVLHATEDGNFRLDLLVLL